MPVHFLDAHKGQCHFPLWGPEKSIGDVCGRPAPAGQSYCLDCRAVAYRPGAVRVPSAPPGASAPARPVAEDVPPDLVELVA